MSILFTELFADPRSFTFNSDTVCSYGAKNASQSRSIADTSTSLTFIVYSTIYAKFFRTLDLCIDQKKKIRQNRQKGVDQMTQMLEIEYKSMLTKQEYEIFIAHYQLTDKDFRVQTNIYFDTVDEQLKKQNCGLRIRFVGHQAEYTLKTPAEKGRLETTDTFITEEAEAFIFEKRLPRSGAVFQKLSDLNIDPASLIQTGKLTTKRAEFPIEEGLLAIDESWGDNLHDFELELEVGDASVGKIAFINFLKRFSLPYRPAKNKIQRMLEAKN